MVSTETHPLRLSNLLLVLGRAGVAVSILYFAVCIAFAMRNWIGVSIGSAVLVLDAAAWCWALGNPLWIDVGIDGIRVRWLFSTRDYTWQGLKVFWMTDVSTVRAVRMTRIFVHIRLSEGKWFKVRVTNNQIEPFTDFVPERSRGTGVITRVELNG